MRKIILITLAVISIVISIIVPLCYNEDAKEAIQKIEIIKQDPK